MVSSDELLVKLYPCYRERCKQGYRFLGAGERHWPCMPQARGGDREVFYMYMCHFSQLHVRLPLDNFTMGVLRALNVAPTQLRPNSWAYMQAFRVLCQSLYLQPSPHAFLYFYDTRPAIRLLGYLWWAALASADWTRSLSPSSISKTDTLKLWWKRRADPISLMQMRAQSSRLARREVLLDIRTWIPMSCRRLIRRWWRSWWSLPISCPLRV